MVMDSQLWHCGGPNTSADDWRLGLNVQYVRGFFRTQQNHCLVFPFRARDRKGIRRGDRGAIGREGPSDGRD